MQNFITYLDMPSGLRAATAVKTYYTKAQSDAAVAVVAATAAANTAAITTTTAATATNQSGISAPKGNFACIMSGNHALEALNVFDESFTAGATPKKIVSLKCKSDAINTASLLINH